MDPEIRFFIVLGTVVSTTVLLYNTTVVQHVHFLSSSLVGLLLSSCVVGRDVQAICLSLRPLIGRGREAGREQGHLPLITPSFTRRMKAGHLSLKTP